MAVAEARPLPPLLAMVAARTGSYALAGAVVAAGMVSLALFAPILGRLVDRYGQRRPSA